MKNKASLFFVLLATLVSIVSSAMAMTNTIVPIDYPSIQPPEVPDVKEMSVYVKGDLVWYGFCYQMPGPAPNNNPWLCSGYQYSVPAIERGEDMSVKVVFEPGKNRTEVIAKAWINGYSKDIEDETGEFDIFANHTYSKYLALEIPQDIDAKQDYTLYVEIQDNVALTGVAKAQINLAVQKPSNELQIKSVELYAGRDICSCSVEKITKGQCGECNIAFEAGSTLYADVVVKNMGSQTQEDVYVKMSIPELCLERTVYLGDLVANAASRASSADTKEVTIALVLPKTAKGSYELKLEAFGDNASAEVTQTIVVAESKADVQIFFENSKADVKQGEAAVYNLYVANLGDAETFTVSVEGANGWAQVQTTPAVFTLGKNESKMVAIQVTPNSDALVATHQFSVKVHYGSEEKTFNLSANVTKASNSNTGLWLLIAGIILAIIIIVLLVLLIVKNHKSQAEKPAEEYSYY